MEANATQSKTGTSKTPATILILKKKSTVNTKEGRTSPLIKSDPFFRSSFPKKMNDQ